MLPNMNQSRRVVVTGIGTVSPFGVGADLFWHSLVNGVSAIRPIESFDTSAYRGKVAAAVPSAVFQDQDLPARYGNPQEKATLFATMAAEEALLHAGLPLTFPSEARAGCAIGTLCSGAHNLEKYGRSFLYEQGELPADGGPPDSIVVSYQLNHLTGHFNLTGPSTLVSTACASSTDAIGFAFDAIRNGECEIMLAGGGDVIGEVVHGGFNAVFSITTSKARPFDRERDGFAIGEGGAFIVMESLDSALRRNATIYGEVLGYGLSNSAYHLTSTSKDGEGEGLAIRRALAEAQLEPAQISYINAHGTATSANDATETCSIHAIFGDHAAQLYVSSIKPMIGHCMGAAGIFEAIATILTVHHGLIPPTINTAGNEAGMRFNLVKDSAVKTDVRYAISESFGFAGACSCVVIGKYNNDQPGN